MRNDFKKFWTLVFTIYGLTISGYSSARECVVVNDERNLYSLGVIPIGDHKSSYKRLFSSFAKSSMCIEDESKLYADCEYMDNGGGVSYLVDGDVVIKETIYDLSVYKKPIIAGIRKGDSILDVVRKLKELPDNFPVWTIGWRKGGRLAMVTEACFQASNGAKFGYDLLFDADGRLFAASISLSSN